MHKRIWSFVATLLVILIAAGVWLNQNALFDMWRLRGYTPPAEVVKLADETTMTDSARRLFYVYRPALQDKTTFNSSCSNSEQTIVLGCYVQHQGIYLYNVADPRLDGVIEVTAAHEMLHAAYDRLSDKEQKRIDALTNQVAGSLTDERLISTIESYRSKDPSVVPNELHSILATEVQDLPSELETYYSRYFTNRKAIDEQLKSRKTRIDVLNGTLESQQANLKTSYDDLQQKRKGNNIEEYNAAVPAYNQAVVAYNANVNKQKQLVSQYNSLVEQRNDLATEENELIKALDSRETIQSQ